MCLKLRLVQKIDSNGVMSNQCSTSPPVRAVPGKIMLRTGEIFYNHIEIMNVDCLNILKIGVQTGTMRISARTLVTLSVVIRNKQCQGTR